MNRCTSQTYRHRPAWRIGLLAALLSLSISTLAQMAVRQFPPAAQRGEMKVTRPPELLMNGKAERLSPGARIHGANDMLLLSGSIAGQNVVVNFVREPQGLIHEVWILNAAEAQAPLTKR